MTATALNKPVFWHLRVMASMLAVVVFCSPTAFAQSKGADVPAQSLLRCAAITPSIERLTCFDEITKTLGPPVMMQTPPATGAWQMSTSKSRFDDTQSVYLSTTAREAIVGWPGKTAIPELLIRCREKNTDIFFVFEMSPSVEYGSIDGATLVARLDTQKPFNLHGSKSTDGDAVFLDNPVAGIKQLFGHKELLIRFTPFNSSPQETSFEIAGLDDAIKPLREACAW